MKYIIDIDGTICTNTYGKYDEAQPFYDRIAYFNKLYDEGHEIHYWTARGQNSKKDWSLVTVQQILDWEVKHTTIAMKKPSYDVWIDDKAFNVDAFFANLKNENSNNR